MKIKEQKVNDIRKEFDCLLLKVEKASNKGTRMDKIELTIFHSLLELGLSLLMYYIYLVRQKLVMEEGMPRDSTGAKMKNCGIASRNYRSVFGILEILRPKYYSKTDKVYYRLDEELGFPRNSYSYLLTDWLSYGSTEMSFDDSVDLLERILNQKLHATQSSRLTYALSEGVENFYKEKSWTTDEEYSHLCIGADGKGVPVINKEKSDNEKSTAVRVGKGRRGGIKKEATLTLTSSFKARSRTPEGILSGLFNKPSGVSRLEEGEARDNGFHQEKHLRAFVGNKIKALDYGIENLVKRGSKVEKRIIALMDGEPALRKQVLRIIEEKGLAHRFDACILDFIHVLEKVWRVANAYKGEKADDRQDWVEKQARLLLNSKTRAVIDQWKKIRKVKKYSPTQDKHIRDGISYFEKRMEMMDYKMFLEKGYPITTGAIESACGHFVKNRMERNGMRWNLKGAQDMLDIRAIKRNKDWQQYLEYYISREQQRLYKSKAIAA